MAEGLRRRVGAGDGPLLVRGACASMLLPALIFLVLLQIWQTRVLSTTRQLTLQLRAEVTQIQREGLKSSSGAEAVASSNRSNSSVPKEDLETSGSTRSREKEDDGRGRSLVSSCDCSRSNSSNQIENGPSGAPCTGKAAGERGYVAPVFGTCEVTVMGGRRRDGYGSWPLCINHLPASALVYSFGIGLDASFDAAMMAMGATVYGFDPTIRPESIPALFGPRSSTFLSRFVFTQIGLGSSNGVATFLKSAQQGIQSMTAMRAADSARQYHNVGFQAAVLTLPAIMGMFGHDHVDLLKVDVEGIEFYICDTREFLDSLARVGQVIYEFHERLMKDPGQKKARCIEQLQQRGFTLVNQTASEEYVFARVAPKAQIIHLPRGSVGSFGRPQQHF